MVCDIFFPGVALNESPAGLAAYLLEKYVCGTNINNKHVEEGVLDQFDMDELLDQVMIYWVTNSITTSMRLYKESIMDRASENAISR
jgi:hypothetical protein